MLDQPKKAGLDVNVFGGTAAAVVATVADVFGWDW